MTSNSQNPPDRSYTGPAALRREVGLFGAVMMGLGSILGTGVFVSIGIAAGVAGPAVLLAIVLAAFVALCNALSSAQLAACHPVSGGTYEYGYIYLRPSLGFMAGWMFLCAKSASAATAALGFSGYLLHAADMDAKPWLTPVALGTVIVVTLLVLAGIRRSSRANIVIVSVTITALVAFICTGLPTALGNGGRSFSPFFAPHADRPYDAASTLLHATALMFVAYTGYGRIATMGEEIREPRRLIPRAIIVTLAISALLYTAVVAVAVGAVGADGLAAATQGRAAPLEIAARSFTVPGVSWLVTVGAATAMLGVLLNLILGLSRVLLAMGRRGDMPHTVTKLDGAEGTPYVAVAAVGVVIAGLAAIGSVKTTWSFSAFTVLVYYAITNAAALRLGKENRLYPRFFAWVGLGSCIFLAFWVEHHIWLAGLGLIAVGLLWHLLARRLSAAK